MAYRAQPEDRLENRKDGMAETKKDPWLDQDSPEVQRELNETNSNDFDNRNREEIRPWLDEDLPEIRR